jgi:hypothetical protein
MSRYAYKLGAVFYILWGLLHIGLGFAVLYRLSTKGGTAALALIGSAVPPADLPPNLSGVAAGVIGQHAWNLALFGLLAVVIGIVFNWRNSRLGYWLNLALVSGADVGFLGAIVIPRYNTPVDGLAGPTLWVLAVLFSTIGLLSGKVARAPRLKVR